MTPFILSFFFLKRFCSGRRFLAYPRQFPAGENVQVAGDIAGRRRLLTTLQGQSGCACPLDYLR